MRDGLKNRQIKELCFLLKIDYEIVVPENSTREEILIALFNYLGKKGRLEELIALVIDESYFRIPADIFSELVKKFNLKIKAKPSSAPFEDSFFKEPNIFTDPRHINLRPKVSPPYSNFFFTDLHETIERLKNRTAYNFPLINRFHLLNQLRELERLIIFRDMEMHHYLMDFHQQIFGPYYYSLNNPVLSYPFQQKLFSPHKPANFIDLIRPTPPFKSIIPSRKYPWRF